MQSVEGFQPHRNRAIVGGMTNSPNANGSDVSPCSVVPPSTEDHDDYRVEKDEHDCPVLPDSQVERSTVLLEEVKWRIDGARQTADSVAARAGALIGFAVLTSSLQKSVDPGAMNLAIVASLVAAAFGIFAAAYPSKLLSATMLVERKAILERPPDRAKLWLANDKVERYAKATKSLKVRYVSLALGYFSLALSIFFALAGLVVQREPFEAFVQNLFAG